MDLPSMFNGSRKLPRNNTNASRAEYSIKQAENAFKSQSSENHDRYTTRTKSFYGQPFVFNMIHTFGGQMAMFGRRNSVNQRVFEARNMINSTMVGTGFAMEGIHNSYVMYDLLSEMSWRKQPISNHDTWFQVNYLKQAVGNLI